jgi:ABC-type Fe3+-hydroxamate transport system substrate-binding protein
MQMSTYQDQLDYQIELSDTPGRIVSLVPSQTELLYTLGLEASVIGITKFCVHPNNWQQTKTIVGGTKNFRFDVIDHLKPDLIIGNKEENYKEGIEKLKEKYPVWMSDIENLPDAFMMIKGIGQITNTTERAKLLVDSIQQQFQTIKRTKPAKVLYLIWRRPWMAAGSKTFIHTMLEAIGLKNCLEHRERYPELSNEDIQSLAPKYILLSSEPYPFQEQHKNELTSLCPSSKIMLVDGEMFSWYGSRLVKAPAYFNTLDFS